MKNENMNISSKVSLVPDALFVRTVVKALDSYLGKISCSISCVSCCDVENSSKPPVNTWPIRPNIGYLIQDGSNEGTFITLVHETDWPESKTVNLISLKYLTEDESIFQEAAYIMRFFREMDVSKLLELQSKTRHNG